MKKRLFLGVLIGIVISLLAIGGLYYFDIISFSNEKETTNKENDEIKDNVTIHEANDYITIEEKNFEGAKATIKKVKFNYLDESLTSEFYQKQEDIIKNVKDRSNKDLFDGEYELKYFINNNILSVIYSLSNSDEIGRCATEKAVLNVDLVKNEIVTEEELLNNVGSSYKKIVEETYEKELASWTERNEQYGNNGSFGNVTYDDFKANKEKYVNKGLESIQDIIYTYIENGKVKYDYYTIKLDSLFHEVGKGGCFNWKTVELGEYK